MARKKKPAPEGNAFPRKHIPIIREKGDSPEDEGRTFARLLTSPELAAYRILNASETNELGEQADVPTLLEVLRAQAAVAQGADLSRTASMLMNQATALQTLFARLTERALRQSHIENLEPLMRLGLRAQGQCRATLQTLAEIKSPPILYAKQANVTTGPQQINNGDLTRAREIQNPPNQLLTAQHGETLDTIGTGAASGVDSALEAVGIVNRA